MIGNFRGKSHKDIEAANETIISNTSLLGSQPYNARRKPMQSVSTQQLSDVNFDNYIEKRT